ncbi:MAG: 2-octaprenyl-6-methoxyphenyl hydroxylase [Gammaproteobacteria bacterium]|nr:2-octaprenyl-6-methoxyphenyl hydroxylase [Gammaproteobacteria bacterium]
MLKPSCGRPPEKRVRCAARRIINEEFRTVSSRAAKRRRTAGGKDPHAKRQAARHKGGRRTSTRSKTPKPASSERAKTVPVFDFDVLIAGGGLVGASLAAALAPLPLKVGVVEAVPFGAPGQPSYDERVTALSLGSQRVLAHIGVWPALAAEAAPIREVHVSERGRFAKTRLNAQELGVEALGYVVPNRAIGAALGGCLSRQANLQMLAPARVTSVTLQRDCVVATVAGGAGRPVTSKLLVAADGAQSEIRTQLGIAARIWDYGQSALVCNLSVGRPRAGGAWERFTDQGTLALLPMGAERYAFIWTAERAHIEKLLTLPEAEFLQAAAALFNGRVGGLSRLGKRQSYPLKLVRAAAQTRGRALVLGNAAHSLSPIAAQGFNLSLRDVAVLADMLGGAVEQGEDIGAASLLAAYVKSRRRDQTGTAVFTDMLTRTFSNPLRSVALARNAGLIGLELLPFLRRQFLRRSAGLAGMRARVARETGPA